MDGVSPAATGPRDMTGWTRAIGALLADGALLTTTEIGAALGRPVHQKTLHGRLRRLEAAGVVRQHGRAGNAAVWGLAVGRAAVRHVRPDPYLETALARFLAGGVTLGELAAEGQVDRGAFRERVRLYAYRTGRAAAWREAVRTVHRLAAARRFGRAS